MAEKNSAVAVYDSHTDLEKAIGELRRFGMDEKSISIIGREDADREQVVGYYYTGERTGFMGKLGAFWSGLGIFLLGSALFFVPGLGQVIVAGPIVSWIVAALEGAVIVGGLSAIGVALYNLGIPKEKVIKYETFLKANKYLLVVHGTPDEVDRAHKILDGTTAAEVTLHHGEQ
jgi:hypothetical protein